MQIAEDFYNKYDEIITRICKPYWRFLELCVNAVPNDIKSVCELGIGTGNFSYLLRSRFPDILIYGIDKNKEFIEIARKKLDNTILENRDVFEKELPKVDYFISSLMLHHLKEGREEKLLKIANSGKGFINFDLATFEDKNKEDIIKNVLQYARSNNFREEDLEEIASEIEQRDNPMCLYEQKDLFEKNNLNFKILEKDFPFVAYQVSKPIKE